MAFETPDYATLRDRQLRDIRSLLPDADGTSDSDHYVRAAAAGAVIEGIYQSLLRLYKQIWPDTADIDELIKHAGDRGLTRKPATTAAGAITVSGWVGTTLPAGSALRHVNGAQLVTARDTPIGVDGTAQVRVLALESGSSANGLVGNATLISPPLGIDAAVTISVALAGGTDIESPAALLDRLLDLIRRPPAGGNKYDYRRWALEVPGVTAAYVYPLRRGLGTTDVVIVSAGGLPSAELIAQVQAHIDDRRPVTAYDSLVIAPTILRADIRARISWAAGYTLDDIQASADEQLPGALENLIPGDVFYRSRGEAVISDLPGVIDRVLDLPAANIVPVVDATQVEWVRLGSVELVAM